MNLRTKFNLGLAVAAAVALSVSAWISHTLLNQQAQQEVLERARMMMESALAIRAYTVSEVRPLIRGRPDARQVFHPQTVPAYAAHQYVQKLQKQYPDYSYKEATLNPTNPTDRANAWEADLIEYFSTHSEVGEYVGTRETPTGPSLYLSRPIRVENEACLACHSTVAQAPQALLDRYGTANGFGWKLGETVGAQIVSVPMALPLQRAERAFLLFLGSLLTVFVVLAVVLNLMLHMIVTRPIQKISTQADRISKGALDIDELGSEAERSDEIGSLGKSFNRMHRSLNKAVQMLDETFESTPAQGSSCGATRHPDAAAPQPVR